MWGLKDWVGTLYRPGTAPADFLEQYASVFNAVEGNTTFYSLPAEETVARWAEQTSEAFRFAFKFPREVTHDRGLVECGPLVAAFLARLEPLGPRLGPFMIQLPAAFGPSRIDALDGFLADLPPDFEYAVELRHPAFCDGGGEARVNELLGERACDRVLMDTRAMRAGDPHHPDVVRAAHDKPDLPVHATVTHHTPFVRFVGHPDPIPNEVWLARWCERLVGWMQQGRTPYFFAHVPDNVHAPALARRLHEHLRAQLQLDPLPDFPGETEDAGGQLKLL